MKDTTIKGIQPQNCIDYDKLVEQFVDLPSYTGRQDAVHKKYFENEDFKNVQQQDLKYKVRMGIPDHLKRKFL